ncbi:Gfo/Idh/MocA family protein [Adhaeribacter pallidiroseus]|uniref:Glucose-fructose oxidoreductase n=1 Tax=Adhaeribacter pallidiroseus TaxID=2072847 RepID=A0A369QEP5_9BACT|nr:Gfo/Idh/MocA family oxidoreductase [Adhaeribacter pallidiroseus]RDC61717.1 Glucose-fructose oxidoreductase [Adhaeribacter pallidiroseus]
MKDLDNILNTLTEGEDGYTRRTFLANTGKGILAAATLGSLAACDTNAQQKAPTSPTDKDVHANSITEPIELKEIADPSEKKKEPFPAPEAPDKRVGFALVGLGNLTLGELLPAFGNCKYAKVTALVSGNPEKAQKVAKQYGIPDKGIYNYQNFDNIKNNPDVQVVYIVLPNSMHEEFTVRSANAGKHVLCEKPMSVNSESAQRMINACEKAGKKLMIAYRIQYEPNNQKAKEWTRNKKMGTVKIIDAINTQNQGEPGQWRLKKALAGGGSLPDIGLYCLNTARYLLGEEPVQVNATLFNTPNDPRFKEVEETVFFQLQFPSGALANCTTSYGVHESKRYRCHADKGGYFGLDPAFSYHGLRMEGSQVQDGMEVKINPSAGDKNQFALEIDHMARCVTENKKPYTPGEEGLQDHVIMEAIYESAKTGKPVKLKKIDKIDAFRGTTPDELQIS